MSSNLDPFSLAWSLLTHPFSPSCDSLGNNLEFNISRSLSPLRSEKLLQLYYDVYNWEESPAICKLSPEDGLAKFPNLDDLVDSQEAFVVVVSGSNWTGVQSLVNLIQYKAQKNSSNSPIMFSAQLVNDREVLGLEKKVSWVKTIIKFFNDEYCITQSQPTIEQLKAIYDSEVAELDNHPSGYLDLPQRIRKAVRRHSDHPIVFTIDLENDLIDEHWQDIYEIVKKFANLLIIPTRKSAYASNFYRSNNMKMSLVHIEACKLDLEATQSYLLQRLGLYRRNQLLNNLPDTTPFSEDALSCLFAPGSNTKDTSRITFPIGYLNKRLKAAVDKQAQKLKNLADTKGLSNYSQVSLQEILIQKELMEQIISELNKE